MSEAQPDECRVRTITVIISYGDAPLWREYIHPRILDYRMRYNDGYIASLLNDIQFESSYFGVKIGVEKVILRGSMNVDRGCCRTIAFHDCHCIRKLHPSKTLDTQGHRVERCTVTVGDFDCIEAFLVLLTPPFMDHSYSAMP